ncbi:hypothetical protein PsorP6_009869 [Peronosclerospora sorghi]|uniref:Uncharacterized protein n=1 Tax=Peronosclerospora sorghi TaxID=230839 RepID=A0ACC0W045_9STRA|nr:hypothetical protein PsorP6_009869 [Peronosclerospora sorghi]
MSVAQVHHVTQPGFAKAFFVNVNPIAPNIMSLNRKVQSFLCQIKRIKHTIFEMLLVNSKIWTRQRRFQFIPVVGSCNIVLVGSCLIYIIVVDFRSRKGALFFRNKILRRSNSCRDCEQIRHCTLTMCEKGDDNLLFRMRDDDILQDAQSQF